MPDLTEFALENPGVTIIIIVLAMVFYFGRQLVLLYSGDPSAQAQMPVSDVKGLMMDLVKTTGETAAEIVFSITKDKPAVANILGKHEDSVRDFLDQEVDDLEVVPIHKQKVEDAVINLSSMSATTYSEVLSALSIIDGKLDRNSEKLTALAQDSDVRLSYLEIVLESQYKRSIEEVALELIDKHIEEAEAEEEQEEEREEGE